MGSHMAMASMWYKDPALLIKSICIIILVDLSSNFFFKSHNIIMNKQGKIDHRSSGTCVSLWVIP